MIRDATEFDTDAISEVSQHLGYEPAANEDSSKWITDVLDANTDKLLVYDREEMVIGCIHATLENRVASPSFIEITGLVVNPNFRRAGIATALVKSVEDWAKSLKLKVRVRSNLIREETHDFYQAIGFIKIKTQHVFEKSL